MSLTACSRMSRFQTVCNFLYPTSCFMSSSKPASPGSKHKVRAIDTNRRHDLSTSCRKYTTSARRSSHNTRGVKLPVMATDKPKSYKVLVKDEIGKRGLPNDIGLFENTLIMPTGKSKPGIFSKPRLRAALEWQRLKSRALDMARMIIYKFTIGKPRPKLHVWKMAGIAKKLHVKTFKAFAEGDMATLNTICTNGVQQQFASQIAARPKNVKYVWTLHKYLGRPRVVSHKSAILNATKPHIGQRQAVVRIRSLQSLGKIDTRKNGSSQPKTTGAEELQKKCEYFVIQQRFTEGVGAGDWLAWGTTSESVWEDVLERAGYEDVHSEMRGEKTADIIGK